MSQVSPEPDDESTPVTRDDDQQEETPTDSAGRSKVPNQAMISKMAGSFKGKENGAVDHSAPKHRSKRTPLGQAVQQKPGAKRLTIAERAQQVCASHPSSFWFFSSCHGLLGPSVSLTCVLCQLLIPL